MGTDNRVITSLQEVEPEKAQEFLNLFRYKKALARRNFLKNVGLAGIGVAAGALVEGCSSSSTSHAAGPSETDVLNFALNLEYLEAEFYSVAVTGSTLSSSVTGGTSKATGGSKVPFSDSRIADIAAEINADETLHVKFLRGALGAMAVAEPSINLNALGIGFANDNDFLTLSRAFEDTGVSAYAGAATLLTGNNLQAAAQILGTEAYHAGNIRLNVVQKGITVTALDSQDVVPTEQHFFPTDANGLAIKRTTSQVLAIVYANSAPGTKSGGFFPNGVNGTINTV
ncbi:MAG: ferritin-like domain-containing protein [Candidatus Acidiferrales bacterium]